MNITKLVLWNMTHPFDKRKSVADIEQAVSIAKITRPLRDLHRQIRGEVDAELAAKKSWESEFESPAPKAAPAVETKNYEIWMEGYRATGESSRCQCMGNAQGVSFLDAVKKFMHSPKHAGYFRESNGKAFYWGCELFDNEKDAAKSFG